MDVVLVRWPDEEERLADARAAGAPRLLLVGPGVRPPEAPDCLEDWVRLPCDERDLRLRVEGLVARATRAGESPSVDEDGLLRLGDAWVALSPVESALAAALVERFGAVVGRDGLARRAWPAGAPTRNALDVHMLRLRRRIAGLGLEVRTVRSRGYLMQRAPATGLLRS